MSTPSTLFDFLAAASHDVSSLSSVVSLIQLYSVVLLPPFSVVLLLVLLLVPICLSAYVERVRRLPLRLSMHVWPAGRPPPPT